MEFKVVIYYGTIHLILSLPLSNYHNQFSVTIIIFFANCNYLSFFVSTMVDPSHIAAATPPGTLVQSFPIVSTDLSHSFHHFELKHSIKFQENNYLHLNQLVKGVIIALRMHKIYSNESSNYAEI